MSDIAIRVENLSKRYKIGVLNSQHDTLRETLARVARAPIRALASVLNGRPPAGTDGQRSVGARDDTIWALKDASFEIKQGEVIGIIGRNGAGKSTLLKILSRITEPTTGRAEINGRVGCLLEVGTGFHPELTGRENIYLNGAILGMKRLEIGRKFDAIVAFAEIEKFIDTPVKRYSTGMYVRLAFAIAAHMEPDILIVDEALAVGDARFQRKCLKKIEDIGRVGRTVLFVSHNATAVGRLCPRVILLDQGVLVADGPVNRVMGMYEGSHVLNAAAREWPKVLEAPGNEIVRLRAARVNDEDSREVAVVDIRRPVCIEMEYEVLTPGHVLVPNYHVYNGDGTCLFVVIDQDPTWRRRPRPVGHFIHRAWIPANLLAEGLHLVGFALTTLSPLVVHFYEQEAVAFNVVDNRGGETARGDYTGDMPGVVRPLLQCSTEFRDVSGVQGRVDLWTGPAKLSCPSQPSADNG